MIRHCQESTIIICGKYAPVFARGVCSWVHLLELSFDVFNVGFCMSYMHRIKNSSVYKHTDTRIQCNHTHLHHRYIFNELESERMSNRSTNRPTDQPTGRSHEREREENTTEKKTKKKIHKRHAQSWIEFNGSRIFSFSCTFSSVLIICFPLFRLIFPVENVTVIHRMHCPRASYRLLHKKTNRSSSSCSGGTEQEGKYEKHTQKRSNVWRTSWFHLLLNFRWTMIRRF